MNLRRAVRMGLACLLLLCGLLGQGALSPAKAQALLDYEPGQVVVKVAGLAEDIILINLLFGTTTLEVLPDRSDIFLLQAPMGADIPLLVEAMAIHPLVAYVEPNYTQRLPETQTDSIYAWGGQDPAPLVNNRASNAVRMNDAHTLSQGEGTIVAVVDTGAQLNHPMLADSLTVRGFDFVDNDSRPRDEPNYLDDDADGHMDEAVGHGTHIAGIVHLVAPAASIMPLRALNSDGQGNNFDTASAILFAITNGADVINLSLGSPHQSALLREVVEQAVASGVVLAAAAGNTNSDTLLFPAAESCVLAVTSVSSSRYKSAFASFGSWVDAAAPGESIYSTVPTNSYAWWSGTSMATPFVAGQAALLRSFDPDLTLQEVGLLVGGTARRLDSRNPLYTGLLGSGQIDLYASLLRLVNGTWPSPQRSALTECE